MTTIRTHVLPRPLADAEWFPFPGGELEGRPVALLCTSCREKGREAPDGAKSPQAPAPLCFHCYRADRARERALEGAATIDTASVERFQGLLPFEPVNHARLNGLRLARAASREAARLGPGRFDDRRRRAQLQARHVLQSLGDGLRRHRELARQAPLTVPGGDGGRMPVPDAWVPFVAGGQR